MYRVCPLAARDIKVMQMTITNLLKFSMVQIYAYTLTQDIGFRNK